VNLAVINLLPIPVLDGGHLLFFVIEAVKGRPVSLKVREVAQQVGMVLLAMLMILVFYNDITRLFFSS
jgi:regulator of sigma E protease